MYKKYYLMSFFLGTAFLFIGGMGISFAAPIFSPGETLNPDCVPGQIGYTSTINANTGECTVQGGSLAVNGLQNMAGGIGLGGFLSENTTIDSDGTPRAFILGSINPLGAFGVQTEGDIYFESISGTGDIVFRTPSRIVTDGDFLANTSVQFFDYPETRDDTLGSISHVLGSTVCSDGFTGAGGGSFSGTYTGGVSSGYQISIESGGVTFSWSENGVTQATGIPISASAFALSQGVSFTFNNGAPYPFKNNCTAAIITLGAGATPQNFLFTDSLGNLLSAPLTAVVGASDTLASLSCANNEIAKWDGSDWVCASDATGSGGGTATNGLSDIAGSIGLGGSLTQDTAISLNGHDFTFSNSSYSSGLISTEDNSTLSPRLGFAGASFSGSQFPNMVINGIVPTPATDLGAIEVTNDIFSINNGGSSPSFILMSRNSAPATSIVTSVFSSENSDATIIRSEDQLLGTGSDIVVYKNGISLSSPDLMSIMTPNIHNATAANGQVLTLVDAATGEVEYVTAAGSAPELYDENPVAPITNTVTGANGVAIGSQNSVLGEGAIALGIGNYARSYGEIAMGLFGTWHAGVPIDTTSFAGDNILFTVGNGTGLGSESDAFTILKNGQVAIGIDSFNNASGINNGNIFQIGDGAGNMIGYVDDATGNWTSVSDQRVKQNISDLNYGLKEINQLRPTQYDLKRNDVHNIGFIAQEVKQVIPEIVSGDSKYGYGIAYAALTPVLTKAIQELDQKFNNSAIIYRLSENDEKTLRDIFVSSLEKLKEITVSTLTAVSGFFQKLTVNELEVTEKICNAEGRCVTIDQVLDFVEQQSSLEKSNIEEGDKDSIPQEPSEDKVVSEEKLENQSITSPEGEATEKNIENIENDSVDNVVEPISQEKKKEVPEDTNEKTSAQPATKDEETESQEIGKV
jgi:hypothetical protein